MVLEQYTHKIIFGLPLIAYGGILTLISLLTTATMGLFVTKGKVDVRVHKTFAITTILLALTHGILGMLAYF